MKIMKLCGPCIDPYQRVLRKHTGIVPIEIRKIRIKLIIQEMNILLGITKKFRLNMTS
jgi:hypothetical protein